MPQKYCNGQMGETHTAGVFSTLITDALFFGRPDCKNSPQSHIVKVYDAGLDESGVFHSAEWHVGDGSSDGIREAWLRFFIWVDSFRVFWLG
ncbi:hypothetical protein TNCV_1077201 [Trichonephila clavipes]|uniref:Uncharacterized protein n=1 Tax=Trichonephila clavipes TaxID=2585209 RepID=A0A8X6V8V5_TRICX|nr:hypothetical protein TNCV_1077201 [Trichonephila clavipes]